MRKRIVFALVLINVLLAGTILLGPVSAQILNKAFGRDCCQGPVCCENCCWFINDCDGDDEDCDPD